ncbi:ribosomal protein S15 [Cordyceps fumosorosea ARSEF 2679]|uniref:Ribosomal protein S15 n=1 Tax=Cordyceps fumosorosea (strain ARSEF 2679) TaxID=1081104 RepID=A0A162MKA9_CORFA|nr:ribosomal protein S15 [Cordyceps fumosorosea ARSEF 2679]OAA63200.1 ribosomal protein S15 [Cordyceps fumosorosea ARSEF 2679]
MPPRLEALPRLGTIKLCLRPATTTPKTPLLPLIQTANLSQRERKRKAKQDPYRWAQAQQRKNANLKRRGELQAERDALLGDPIWGRNTPFLESLKTAAQPTTTATSETAPDGSSTTTPRSHYLSDAEIDEVAEHARALTKPVVGAVSAQLGDAPGEAEAAAQHERRHSRAIEALHRITALANGSKRDAYHFNVRRIVDEFGRHSTDGAVAPKPRPVNATEVEMPGRAGADTGSSEVQIAILTARIRNLADALSVNRGYKDIHNKRSLRLMLHKRQKLLRYMERKEKGSGRWTNMIEKLGLTPAMWKGQIELR